MTRTKYLPRRFENDYFRDWFGSMGPTDPRGEFDRVFFINRRVDGYLRVDGVKGGEEGSHYWG